LTVPAGGHPASVAGGAVRTATGRHPVRTTTDPITRAAPCLGRTGGAGMAGSRGGAARIHRGGL